MKFTDIRRGGENLHVSKIVLGTDYFGTTVPEETALRLMDIYTDAGGNCIDTARVYASWLPGGDGASERTVGRWLKSRGCRNKVIMSTKGGHPLLEQMSKGRLSGREIESDLDESLRALGINEVDIYWLHRDDISRPVEDILETMSILVEKGKVREVGCSNWKTDRIAAANGITRALSQGTARTVSFSASQIMWSLATSTPELHGDPTIVCMDENEYRWYEKERFPVFAYSSQAKGFFARGAADGIESINQKARKRFLSPENIGRLERVREYASKTGITPTAISLGYLTCNRVPAVAIVGCKNEAQLYDSLTASDVSIPGDIVDWLYKG